MIDIKYLGTKTGEFVGDLNDIHFVTDADWTAAAAAALLQGADPAAVADAVANKATSGSELLKISAVGDIQIVLGSDRLKQDVTKILITERGLAPYPNYGTILASVVGARSSDTDVLSFVADDVITALKYQSLLERSTTLDEILGQIVQLDVEFSSSALLITLQLETAAKTSVDLQFTI